MSEKPEKPNEEDCCGSGCRPCIFDIYQEKLKKWQQGNLKSIDSNALNEIKYSPFVVASIDDVTESVKIFKFQAVELIGKRSGSEILIENAVPKIDYEISRNVIELNAGQYLILRGTSESNGAKIALSRSYTPIIDKSEQENGAFATIVSLRPLGKMSQFLMGLKTSDIVFWRGPYREFEYTRNACERILMIGGGTGIVPLYNIAKAIVEDDKNDTRLKVFCSFRSTERIILRSELNRLKDYWNFQLRIFITDENENDFRSKYNESIEFGKMDESVIFGELKNYETNKFSVIVSGPDSFNKFVSDTLRKFGIELENIFVFW